MRVFEDYEFDDAFRPSGNPSEYTATLELRDGWNNLIGEVGDYTEIDLAFNSMPNDVEASTFTVPASSQWSKTLMRANRLLLRVHVQLYRDGKFIKEWTGSIERSVRSMEHKQGKISCEMISDKAYFRWIAAWSAPFAPLWLQFPKRNIKLGRACGVMKQFLLDNLLRLQNRNPVLNPILTTMSTYQEIPSLWDRIEEYMWPIIVVPSPTWADTSPIVTLMSQMTPISDLWFETCKDYNLLPTISYHVPGRDPELPHITVTKPCLVVDIIDKDKARTQGDMHVIEEIVREVFIFIRGLFGRFDAPPVIDLSDTVTLTKYFGRTEDDAWPIFRTSYDHWFTYEVSSYAPTVSTSIAGGKSQEFFGQGVRLLGNGLIRHALALVGIGFKGNFITNQLDDILFAYQKADDPGMREELGPYTYFEEYLGSGMTAYSYDSAQALRLARHNAIGYKTATFSGDLQTMLPFRPFEDFDLLDPCAWEDPDEDRLVPERLKEIGVNISESGVSWDFRLGEIERPEEPWAIQIRRNEMFKRSIIAAFNAD